MMIEFNLTIIGLILSIIFSCLEIALICANKLQIDVWIKQKYKLGSITKSILENKSKFLIVTLIGTTLSNILCSSFFTVYLIKNNIVSSSLTFIPISMVILLFGEIIPKTIIREYANIMLMILSPIMILFYYIFYPIVFIFNKLNIFNKEIYLNIKSEEKNINRQEVKNVYEQADDNTFIESGEKEIISNIFEYSTKNVSEIMTPRTDISAISDQLSLDEIAHVFIDSGHSKLPVYNENIDNITGMIYLYDLYSKPKDLSEIIKDTLIVPFSKPVNDLMEELKEKNLSIAIVIDEHAGTAGLVTIEDIFEELFGDFEDEFDYDEVEINKNDDGSISLNAKIECSTFNNKFGNIIPEGDYETLGGYIINKIGRIPNENEHLFLDIGQVIIKKSSSRRIKQMQIFLSE
jgi:CBS domain containing-hemolysin-like protein